MSIEETRLVLWETAKELSERWPDLRPEGTDAEPKPFKHLTMCLLLVELGADMVLLAHEVAVSQGAPPPLEHVEAPRLEDGIEKDRGEVVIQAP